MSTTKARPLGVGAVLDAKIAPVTAKRPVYWMGTAPTECQLSGRAIDDEFVDGTVPGMRPWANWHPREFVRRGGTYGTGRGQLFTRQADGQWLKTKG